MRNRLCYECQKFHISFGVSDWSEVTPGSPAEVSCDKGHFLLADWIDRGKFAAAIRTAENCNDYDPDPELAKIGRNDEDT